MLQYVTLYSIINKSEGNEKNIVRLNASEKILNNKWGERFKNFFYLLPPHIKPINLFLSSQI
jgi:hypothetical protein